MTDMAGNTPKANSKPKYQKQANAYRRKTFAITYKRK